VVPAKSSSKSNSPPETVAAMLNVHVGRGMLDDQIGRSSASLVGRARRQCHRASIWSVLRGGVLPAFSSQAHRERHRYEAHVQ